MNRSIRKSANIWAAMIATWVASPDQGQCCVSPVREEPVVFSERGHNPGASPSISEATEGKVSEEHRSADDSTTPPQHNEEEGVERTEQARRRIRLKITKHMITWPDTTIQVQRLKALKERVSLELFDERGTTHVRDLEKIIMMAAERTRGGEVAKELAAWEHSYPISHKSDTLLSQRAIFIAAEGWALAHMLDIAVCLSGVSITRPATLYEPRPNGKYTLRAYPKGKLESSNPSMEELDSALAEMYAERLRQLEPSDRNWPFGS